MNYRIVGGNYVEVLSAEPPVHTEQDALELVSLCLSCGIMRLMLRGEALSEDFFCLRTGVAGAVVQKLVNYAVKTAVILPDSAEPGEHFSEWRSETNKSRDFGIFSSGEDAEAWLLK